MTYLLAGDLGGTKTLLRLVKAESPDRSEFEYIYKSQEYTSLVSIAQEFLAAARTKFGSKIVVQAACLAIAGAVIDRVSYLPNLDWHISADELQQELKIPHIELINDFAAVGYGITLLPPQDLHIIQTGQSQQNAPKAVIGAGTGLGEALLIHNGTDYQVIPTEGGHTDFAARSIQEFEFVQYLCRQQQVGRISNDRVISGRGIVAIYQYLRDTSKLPENPEIASLVKLWASQTEKLADPAALISAMAIAKTDPLAQATMQIFVTAYGAEAGNLALKILPYGGLYIAGGIAAKNLPLLTDGTFATAFNDKGRVRDLLGNIPIYVILNPQVGLIGAAAQAVRLVV
ncbi:MAG: glucokinase [Chamaesiphon sp.]|nr:glucokinase [Chamaesiphon sp.]